MTPYIVAALFYLVVTLPLIRVVTILEKRLAASDEGGEVKKRKNRRGAFEQMAEELAEQNIEFPEDSIEVTIDELGVHIRIKDTVLFASGSPDINKNAV
jgi:flagellar motor protein MotB